MQSIQQQGADTGSAWLPAFEAVNVSSDGGWIIITQGENRVVVPCEFAQKLIEGLKLAGREDI